MKREPLARGIVRMHVTLDNIDKEARPMAHRFFENELERLTRTLTKRLQQRFMGFDKISSTTCTAEDLTNPIKRNLLRLVLEGAEETYTLEIRPTFGMEYDYKMYALNELCALNEPQEVTIPDSLLQELHRVTSMQMDVHDVPLWPYADWFVKEVEARGGTVTHLREQFPTYLIKFGPAFTQSVKVQAAPNMIQFVAMEALTNRFVACNGAGVLQHMDRELGTK